MQPPPFDFWARTRLPRITFLVGLVLGVLMGWFFHGVISFVIRLGFVILLLIPLGIALYFWFRLRQQNPPTPSGTMTVVSVDAWDAESRYGQSARPRRSRQPFAEDRPD